MFTTIVLAAAFGANPDCGCTCAPCRCYDATAALAFARVSRERIVPKQPLPVPKQPVAATNDLGHTHTCANGHTWNHAQNPTHTCQVCGLNQFVQDAQRTITPQVMQSFPQFQSIGGCPNGNCAVPNRIFKRGNR